MVWQDDHPLLLGGHCYCGSCESSAVQLIDVLRGFYQGGSNESGHDLAVSISCKKRLRTADKEVRLAGLRLFGDTASWSTGKPSVIYCFLVYHIHFDQTPLKNVYMLFQDRRFMTTCLLYYVLTAPQFSPQAAEAFSAQSKGPRKKPEYVEYV